MQTINVTTTQNVGIEYPVASIGDRILAYILDRILLVIFSVLIVFLIDLVNSDVLIWIWLILLISAWLFYHLAFEIFMNGQSPGKRVMNIQVVRLDGTEPSVGDYLMRWVLSLIDFYILSGAIAVITIAANGRGQRVGDVAAGTTVVKRIPRRQVDAGSLFITPEDSYTPVFPQVAQLGSRDIEIVQRALEANTNHGNREPVLVVAGKIKTLLSVESELPPEEFLYTVVKDFNHLTAQ